MCSGNTGTNGFTLRSREPASKSGSECKMADTWRGNPIVNKGGDWFYEDGVQVSSDPSRICGKCNLVNRKDMCDPCLGKLEGVKNACCGHGERESSYIQFENGITVRGFSSEGRALD